MVDPERVADLLKRLEDRTNQLRALAKSSPSELLADRVKLDAAKYGLVISVEICIDVADHIIASEGLRPPEKFADMFVVVGEAGFLPQGAVPQFQEMAKFRDLLVHEYARVDDHRVVEILRTRLGDFDRFRAEVARAAVE